MHSGSGTHTAASHSLTQHDARELSREGRHITNGRIIPPAVAGHGFLTATEILALLLQLDVDATIAGLSGAPGLVSAPSAVVPAPTGQRHERRSARRLERRELIPELRLTIPGASTVGLVNISETGLLIETSGHAGLGTTVDLFVRVKGRRYRVRARSVRSSLFTIRPESGVVYRTAMQFEQPLPLKDLLRR